MGCGLERGYCLTSKMITGCRQWAKSAAVSWLLNTQLCPVIWALILALLAVLIYKVGAAPAHPATPRQYI